MKKTHIRDYLKRIGIDVEDINLGQFDYLGQFTANRWRDANSLEFKRYGMFYRSSYERAILVYYLIKQFDLRSVLEIGFGRGCMSFAAAMSFNDGHVDGHVTSIDPKIDEGHVSMLKHVFPQEWFDKLTLMQGTSQEVLTRQSQSSGYDLVLIDGDHSYEGTRTDLNLTKNLVNKFLLCDDYHLPDKVDPGIQCRQAIDEIDLELEGYEEPELIILDRRIFVDERGYADEQVNYGQVLFQKKSVVLTRVTEQQELNDW